METLVFALSVLVSILVGAISVGLYSLNHHLSLWRSKITAIEHSADLYKDHLTKAAESNNALVAKVVELTDKVSTHEIMLKGQRR
jgi:hypothetical protein